MKRIASAVLFFGLLASAASSQYLEVRRAAIVKEQPAGNAGIIERVQSGDFLRLLNNGQQQNGYYRVRAKSVAQDGWIYRTLVRRHEGEMPGLGFVLHFTPAPPGYYAGAEGLEDEALKAALYTIIRNHHGFSYGSLWDYLKRTDLDPRDTTRVIGIYSGFSMLADSEYSGGRGWTREHVWAKSFGDFGTTEGAGTDLHHIRVEDVSTNTARNNRSFDECNQPYVDNAGTYSGPTSSSTSTNTWAWEPRDEVKGDVARMMFYMDVRYEGDDGEPNLVLVDSLVGKLNKKPVHGRVSVLLQWHTQDPVDNYERYRNSVIFGLQNNRNPFIDHPEFVGRIWQ